MRPGSAKLPDPGEMFPQIVDAMQVSRPDDVLLTSIGEGSLTWAELHAAGRQWAARFLALGIEPGDIVANLAEAGLRPICWWLGLSRVGGIDAGINTEFRGRILSYAINNCGARVLMVERQFLPILEQVAGDLETVERIVLLDATPETAANLPIETCRLEDIPVDVAGTAGSFRNPEWFDIACVTYTSGTTGPSKAVRLPWGQLHCVNLGTYPFEDLNADDVFYCISTNAHFGSKCVPYLAAMLGGRVLMRKRFSGTQFWNDVREHRITTVPLVGAMMDLLLRSTDAPGWETTLRNIFMAPLIRDYREFNARFGTRVCTAYNSTEGGLAIHSGWNPPKWKTCGRLREGYPGFEVRIVDEHDIEVADGQVGEAIVRPGVPWTMNAGYLNNAEASAAAWRNGWFHTGDGLMRDADGDYFFVDRMKDAIRRRGENISSLEVETDVMMHPDVEECAAVAVPSDDVEDEILLYVVPRAGSELTPESLVRDLIPRTARFMVPRYVEFIEALPRTDSTRRVKKAELRQRGVGAATWDRQAAGIEIPR